MRRKGKGRGSDVTTAHDAADHVCDSALELLQLAANEGGCHLASHVDDAVSSRFRPGNSAATATANTAADASCCITCGAARRSEATRVRLRHVTRPPDGVRGKEVEEKQG